MVYMLLQIEEDEVSCRGILSTQQKAIKQRLECISQCRREYKSGHGNVDFPDDHIYWVELFHIREIRLDTLIKEGLTGGLGG